MFDSLCQLVLGMRENWRDSFFKSMAAQWWKSQAYVDQFFPSSLKFVKVKILSQNKETLLNTFTRWKWFVYLWKSSQTILTLTIKLIIVSFNFFLTVKPSLNVEQLDRRQNRFDNKTFINEASIIRVIGPTEVGATTFQSYIAVFPTFLYWSGLLHPKPHVQQHIRTHRQALARNRPKSKFKGL